MCYDSVVDYPRLKTGVLLINCLCLPLPLASAPPAHRVAFVTSKRGTAGFSSWPQAGEALANPAARGWTEGLLLDCDFDKLQIHCCSDADPENVFWDGFEAGD